MRRSHGYASATLLRSCIAVQRTPTNAFSAEEGAHPEEIAVRHQFAFRLAAPGFYALVVALAAPAHAQDHGDEQSALEFNVSGRIILALGDFDANDGVDSEPLVIRYEGEANIETILDNGLVIGAEAEIAAERDQPQRDPRGGRAGACPPGLADCAAIAGQPVRSPISGFAGAGLTEQDSLRAALEEAYIYIEGGWGEVSLGLTDGAAAELSLSTPSILAGTSSVDGSLSLSGLGGAQIINDFSGSSAKVTLESVSILGLRGAVSFTPEANYETLDQGFDQRAGGPVDYEGENIIEAGLAFNRVWANGLRTEVAATYLTAENASDALEWERLDAWNVGVQLEWGAVRGGVSYFASDNGWAAGDRGYEALAGSGVYEQGAWSFMLEGSTASDDLAHTNVNTVLAAVRRSLGEHAGLSLVISRQERMVPLVVGPVREGREQQANGVFLEFAADL
jgi:Gram-negative porin